jgi:hypothetical protein
MVLLTMTDAVVGGLTVGGSCTSKNLVSTTPRNQKENDTPVLDDDVEDSNGRRSVQIEQKSLQAIKGSNPTFNDAAGSRNMVENAYPSEPSLLQPKNGNPISHGQMVELWKQLNNKNPGSYRLEELLKGSNIYVSPAPAKPEPVSHPAYSVCHICVVG